MRVIVGPVDHGEPSHAGFFHRVFQGHADASLVMLGVESEIVLVDSQAWLKSFGLAWWGGFIPIMGLGGIGAGIHPRYPQ